MTPALPTSGWKRLLRRIKRTPIALKEWGSLFLAGCPSHSSTLNSPPKGHIVPEFRSAEIDVEACYGA
jgi:hypothetical protein